MLSLRCRGGGASLAFVSDEATGRALVEDEGMFMDRAATRIGAVEGCVAEVDALRVAMRSGIGG